MRHEARGIEQAHEGAITNTQAARVGAEGRHHYAAAVAREAAAADRAAPQREAGDRVQMAGDLPVAGVRRRLVAKHERAEGEPGGAASADFIDRLRVVVAGDPQPLAPSLETGERLTVGRAYAAGGVTIVK